MRRAMLYILAVAFLVVIGAVAWWTREAVLPRIVTVKGGETLQEIAIDHLRTETQLIEANPDLATVGPLPAGAEVEIPPPEPTMTEVWLVHGGGILAEFAGVLMSFWLAIVAGILPRRVRRQVLGISVVLGLASYAAQWATAAGNPQLTPQFVFGAIKDGFAWSAAFPLFARVLGLRDEPARTAAELPGPEPTT